MLEIQFELYHKLYILFLDNHLKINFIFEVHEAMNGMGSVGHISLWLLYHEVYSTMSIKRRLVWS